MEESQITVDGVTYSLPQPYFVIATQNPVETQGTFPLPEAQLDRFMVQLNLGYPSSSETVAVLQRHVAETPIEQIKPVCGKDTLLAMRRAVKDVYIHEAVYGYVTALAEATRRHEKVLLGISTRGCVALSRLAQARAAMRGRDMVTPDDIKELLPYVFAHRRMFRGSRIAADARNVVSDILAATDAPVENWNRKNPAVSE
jgi:MoxR-like ATPase